MQTAEGEFFVPRKSMRGAFPGDLVEIVPVNHRDSKNRRNASAKNRKRCARVVDVIERAHPEVVGYYHVVEPFGIVRPADTLITHDIFTQLSDAPGIPDGAIVRVRITTYPDRHTAATGTVVEVIGDEDDERVMIDLVIARNKLQTAFSPEALAQADEATIDEESAVADGYVDLRGRHVFTVDPVDARDFDDAVSLARETLPQDGSSREYWRVGVHIADVSHFVPWGSSIDLAARQRATSVYLVDRVLPMLPERLTNDVCSLRPHETRRTMTVDLYLDDAGEVVFAKPYLALIRSDARLTYEQAQALIDGETLADVPAAVCDAVVRLNDIAKKRASLRTREGGLDFDTVEAKVQLDDEGFPIGISLREKTDATQLIEEAMIMANEAVACYLRDAEFPCMYRVHEQPDVDALEELVPVLQEFKWFEKVNARLFVTGNPREIQRVLSSVGGRPEGALVTTLLLRSMKRALYSSELSGHYGLASKAYAHFTSPIRRYPDLIVHRMLRAALCGRPEKFDQEVSSLAWLAEHSSEMERVAENAARESQEVKIIEYMEQFVGSAFSGVVSGVATIGLFVRLDNTAEGVIPMEDLGKEYFVLDSTRHTVTGSDSGKEYRLGKRVAVRLVEADCRMRRLRFKLA